MPLFDRTTTPHERSAAQRIRSAYGRARAGRPCDNMRPRPARSNDGETKKLRVLTSAFLAWGHLCPLLARLGKTDGNRLLATLRFAPLAASLLSALRPVNRPLDFFFRPGTVLCHNLFLILVN